MLRYPGVLGPTIVVCLLFGPAAAGSPKGEEGPGLRIYSHEIDAAPFGRVLYGYDRSELCTVTLNACNDDTDCNASNPNDLCGTRLDPLVPGAQTNIWDLVCAPDGGGVCQVAAWDFSANNLTNYPGMTEFATTTTAVDASETCSSNQCGFTDASTLGREDRGFDTANVIPTVNGLEFEDRAPQDHTIWLRAAVRNEGVSGGGIGLSESRICYSGNDDGTPRTEVPLWQFSTCDAQGCYMQLGDSWGPENPTTGVPQPFQCENDVFNHVCPSGCGLFCNLWAYSCGSFGGGQFGEVVNEGQVTLPSGHTFRSLVTRSNAEFCLSLFSSCSNSAQNVRTVLYLWSVPNLGTVVRLTSRTLADSVQDFNPGEDIIAEMDVKFGLLPPLSVSVDAVSDTAVDLSWNPGLITDRIDGYRIHWDTDSGFGSGYAFDSVTHAGQVALAGTSATVSGLTPGTPYFFTVTSVSDYTDPSSSVTTTYQSALPPTVIPAVPVDLPIEVQATTTGGAATAGAVPDGGPRPGAPLSIAVGPGTSITLNWGASCQAGDTDYAVYEGLLGSFGSAAPATCSTLGATTTVIAPQAGDRFYVVVPANAVAEGSYGLDGTGAERPTSAGACLSQDIGAPVCP